MKYRINRGFYRFGETILELNIINHKLMAKTEVRDLSWTMVGLIEQPGFSLVWLAVVDVSQSV